MVVASLNTLLKLRIHMKLAYCDSKSTINYVIYQNIISTVIRHDYPFYDHIILNVR